MAERADADTGLGEAGYNHTASTLTESAADDTALAAWTAVLDVLEMAVQAAERTLKDPLGPLSSAVPDHVAPLPVERWTPPTRPGPLPAAARRRAAALAAAQERVAHRLDEARMDVARQLQAVSSVPGVGESSAAIYLDVNG
ncbi:hypothetical protein [Arthrobacter sp. ES3-54]|uniref:hypothetical protein n=1 Tax=Arthrobacter sp. ES3-54 TaxID=1502991 RepID=UPI002405910B|nr:hypothetical protein [Arthrobacter sp. ES3-54]MDF9752651.1 hypothetical protein [Arthrobacter sp. ES3-54]